MEEKASESKLELELELAKEVEKEFVKHSEIKEYEIKAVEKVRGSSRHSSKFSNEKAIIEDTKKQIEVLSKLSDHVSDLEKRVAALELESKSPINAIK
jgi:hypothetical protein